MFNSQINGNFKLFNVYFDYKNYKKLFQWQV
jgi:hypothetical protein